MDFNVSDNDLAGEIPRWVSRFPASSFAGNKDLCGQPLPYDCSNRTVESESTKPINKRMVPVYIGGDVAAVLGVIVTVTCLVFKRRRGGSGTNGTRGIMGPIATDMMMYASVTVKLRWERKRKWWFLMGVKDLIRWVIC